MFTNKKREGMNRFVCDASLYVAKTSKASIKYHKPPLPIIPCGIVAYGFVGQPFSKQLYIYYSTNCNTIQIWSWCSRYLIVIIHQIFSLARDWSKRVTWPNIPQLKLGSIREYSPILTVRFSEQIMSADKYPSIFSRQMATIVYVYIASYVGRKSEVKKCRQKDLKMYEFCYQFVE